MQDESRVLQNNIQKLFTEHTNDHCSQALLEFLVLEQHCFIIFYPHLELLFHFPIVHTTRIPTVTKLTVPVLENFILILECLDVHIFVYSLEHCAQMKANIPS